MIIAGNSHVSLFDKGLILPEKDNEEVNIFWIGPIKIEHFFNKHSFALKIEQLFEKDKDWKILSIGNHDVIDLVCSNDFNYNSDFLLDELENKYNDIFSKFSEYKNFAWMLSFQQTENIDSDISPIEVLEVSQEFNYRIKKICSKLNIPIIDPLNKLCDDRGFTISEYLKSDKQHFNYKALPFYISELEKITKYKIISLDSIEDIDNYMKIDAESFLYLFLENLGIKSLRYNKEKIESESILFCEQLLKNKDMEMSVDLDTDLTDLLSSLELVELYTFISELFKVDINFKVDIRDLKILGEIINFVEKSIKNTSLSEDDFINSLKLDFINDKDEILISESKIASMPDRNFELFEKIFNSIKNEAFKYGIIYHWFSLVKANRKEYNDAMYLSKKAEDLNLNFPITDNRTTYYRDLWKNNEFNS